MTPERKSARSRPAATPEWFLTSSEVAAYLHVDPRTIRRWADAGKLPAACTRGGHRRFREADVRVCAQRMRGLLVSEDFMTATDEAKTARRMGVSYVAFECSRV